MKHWQRFKTFKLRGEWVELLFMAAAAAHGYHVLTPWGDSLNYDIGIEDGAHFLRVQVKSTASRKHTGYYCQLRGGGRPCGYDLKRVDIFVCYVVPTNVWYLIPAALVLTPRPKTGIVLCPGNSAKMQSLQVRTLPRSLGPARQRQTGSIPPQ